MTRRDDLVGDFLATTDGLGHPITAHVDNVEAELIVDGHQYFTEVFAAIAATKPGDTVLLVGWTFDPNMTKTTATKIGDILAERKFHGVNVHVVLNGSLYQNFFGTPFDQSLRALIDLREKRIPSGATTPPLDPCVLFDFSGAGRTGSHHQKVVVVHDAAANDSVAFIGGIDFWPNRDDTTDHPGTVLTMGGQPWGWHDAAMRVRGQPVADAWANFESRYDETRLLPVKNAWRWNPGGSFPFKLQPYNPSLPTALPPKPAVFTATTPNPDIAVQVLRSRFPIKLPRESPPLLWAFPPTGGIRQTYATLHKAIGAAQRYIYIEDQFIADTYDGDDAGARTVSLLPDLLAAATRNVKIIMLTSGKPEGPSLPALPPRDMQNQVIDKLSPAQRANVSIWKLSNLVVHSKLIMIDDVFAAVGSANLHSRSMWGIDQELHVAVVDAKVDAGNAPAGVVRDWRVRLWAEHLEVLGNHGAFLGDLQDLDTALGMWRQSWRVGGSPGMWFQSDNPPGFAPAKIRRGFVGPPPTEP
jgi:phosphatidylserine/phosphatidylglycerophosphate/cardiolipin synthase-like enzyme